MKSIFPTLRKWTKTHIYESVIILFFSLYTTLRLTPSSYSLALGELGAKKTGLLFGSPRPIKSDEWDTGTPQIIARTLYRNRTSFYHYLPSILDDPLPRHSLRLIFQPFSWTFLIDNALGFSVYFSLSFVLGLLFWPKAFQVIGLDRKISILGGLSVMLSTFVIGWFTHRPGIYGILPILIFSFFRLNSHKLLKFLLLFWLGMVYLEYTFYPPETLLSVLFVILLVFYKGNFRENFPGYLLAALGLLASLILYIYLNKQIWAPYGSTLYPGQRVVPSGLLPFKSFLAQLSPIGYGQSYIIHLAPSNELESATFGSLLPLFVALLVDFNRRLLRDTKLRLLVIAFCGLTCYQLISGLDMLGRITFLSKVPANRTLFLSGLILTLICIHALNFHRKSRITWQRTAIPAFSAITFMLIPLVSMMKSKSTYLSVLHQSDVFLILAFSFLTLTSMFIKNRSLKPEAYLMLFSAPLWIIALHWNPVAKAKDFFSPINSNVTQALENIQNSGQTHNLAVYGFPGQILYGAGLKSLTDRPDIPDLVQLRTMFPALSQSEFDYLFNRVAEIRLDPNQLATKPTLLQTNLVTIPITVAGKFANTVTPLKLHPASDLQLKQNHLLPTPNYLDNVSRDGQVCRLVGWVRFPDVGRQLEVFYPSDWVPRSVIRGLRPDVLRVVKGAGLYNGVELEF